MGGVNHGVRWKIYVTRKYWKRNCEIRFAGYKTKCWLWKFATTNGYGGIRAKNKRITILAHRWAFKLFKGKVPAGKLVLHKCDNRACVRPSHLYAGTHSNNIKDAWTRNRTAMMNRVRAAA